MKKQGSTSTNPNSNIIPPQSFVLVLKKDLTTNLYSLESVGSKPYKGSAAQISSTPKTKSALKRSHQQMMEGDLKPGQKPQVDIIAPKSKKQQLDKNDASARKGGEDTIPVGGEKKTEKTEDFNDQVSNAQLVQQDPAIAKDDEEIQNEDSQMKDGDSTAENQLQSGEYAKNSFIIPSCSGWFNLDKIHEIEMQSLPEFFCGKFPHKNPTTYMDYRNFIIKLYRESPNAYLSATVCRKNLPGDVCSIIRLHAFLEHWGLINFNVDPQLKPPKIQLGASGNLNPTIVDVAAKGYLKLQEAEMLQQYFSKEGDQSLQQNPSQNVFLIAAKKINILSSHKRPVCNFCGNLCGFYWYKKRPPQSSYILKEENQLKGLGEHDSLHSVLKSLSSTYIVCKECFSECNYPKILRPTDFEKSSIESILKSPDLNMKQNQLSLNQGPVDDNESMNEEHQVNTDWSPDDRLALIEAVTKFDGDWEQVSRKAYESKYTPYECAFQFISLPISESLLLKFQNAVVKRGDDIMQNYVPTVFQDYSNPLLAQLAIFAKSLEYSEKEHQSFHIEPVHSHAHQSTIHSEQINGVNGQTEENRRTTRKQQQAKKKEFQQQQLKKIHEDQGDIYLIPQTQAQTCLAKDTLNLIADKAKQRSKRLAKEKRKEIEQNLNLAIYHQMKKLQHKAKFLREFWNNFEVEKRDLQLIREETLAERVALSVLKSGEIKGTTTEKVLAQNEFAASHQLLRQLSEKQ